jgi:hypothetical protein
MAVRKFQAAGRRQKEKKKSTERKPTVRKQILATN